MVLVIAVVVDVVVAGCVGVLLRCISTLVQLVFYLCNCRGLPSSVT